MAIAHRLCIFDLDLDLHFEGLLFHGSAERNQLGEDGLLTFHQEGIDPAGEGGRLAQEFLLLEREKLVIAHQPLSVDHHVAHVGGFGRIDNLRIDVVGRTAESGRVVQRREVDQDQVCPAAGGERAGQCTQMQRLGAHPRCHRQGRGGGQRGWIVGHDLGDEGRQPHFLEHVQVIVGGGAIRADTHVEAGFQHLGHRCEAGGELEIGGRIVSDAGARVQERTHLAGSQCGRNAPQ